MVARNIERKIMATRRSTTQNYKYRNVVTLSLPQPIILTSKQLEEKREKGLDYNCDSTYSKGHTHTKKKLFYLGCEKEEEKEQETSKEEDMHY